MTERKNVEVLRDLEDIRNSDPDHPTRTLVVYRDDDYSSQRTDKRPSEAYRVVGPDKTLDLIFHEGCHPKDGLNGWLLEDLVLIVVDRLRQHQSGPFACKENGEALTHFETGLTWMLQRRQRRKEEGTSGTQVPEDVEDQELCPGHAEEAAKARERIEESISALQKLLELDDTELLVSPKEPPPSIRQPSPDVTVAAIHSLLDLRKDGAVVAFELGVLMDRSTDDQDSLDTLHIGCGYDMERQGIVGAMLSNLPPHVARAAAAGGVHLSDQKHSPRHHGLGHITGLPGLFAQLMGRPDDSEG